MKNDNLELIVLQGLPGSGKTTWARTWVSEKPKERIRVNRDDIRDMLGPYWVPSREKLVTDIEKSSIYNALNRGFSVVSDSTNFRWSDFDTEYNTKAHGCHVKIKQMNVSVEECIRRDQLRERVVGSEVIIRMAKKYLGYNG